MWVCSAAILPRPGRQKKPKVAMNTPGISGTAVKKAQGPPSRRSGPQRSFAEHAERAPFDRPKLFGVSGRNDFPAPWPPGGESGEAKVFLFSTPVRIQLLCIRVVGLFSGWCLDHFLNLDRFYAKHNRICDFR